MGSSEIWDKYHSCCIGNGKFPIQHSWYLSQVSLLPMLLLVLINIARTFNMEYLYTDTNSSIQYKKARLILATAEHCVQGTILLTKYCCDG